jgi:hypothetical protein
MFEIPEEHRMLQDLVAKFVDNELMPLEAAVLKREMQGDKAYLTEAEEAPLLARCKELERASELVAGSWKKRQSARAGS